jgi:hypothetical protein
MSDHATQEERDRWAENQRLAPIVQYALRPDVPLPMVHRAPNRKQRRAKERLPRQERKAIQVMKQIAHGRHA